MDVKVYEKNQNFIICPYIRRYSDRKNGNYACFIGRLRQKPNKINRLHFTGMWSVFFFQSISENRIQEDETAYRQWECYFFVNSLENLRKIR